MIDDFSKDINDGEVHARDRLQFELKSEFLIHPELKENRYRQDFFIFIPNSLQINEETYSSKNFYDDETTIIRYRTPTLTLKEILSEQSIYSPLNRIENFLKRDSLSFPLNSTVDELKLLGTIFKASIRDRVYYIIQKLEKQKIIPELQELSHQVFELLSQTSQILEKIRKLAELTKKKYHFPMVLRNFRYVDELLSITAESYLLELLKELRASSKHHFVDLDKLLCQFVLKEKLYRKKNGLGPKENRKNPFNDESTLYRRGLLNRYVLESLQLKSHRFSLEEKHKDILGVIAAGISMFIYMGLFAWKSPTYILNSFPFVAFAVVLYILKDRIKEGLKSLYHYQAKRWFPDYSTEIRTPKNHQIGLLKESFSFMKEGELSKNIAYLRQHHFHDEFPKLRRQESIIHYKREVFLKQEKKYVESRRRKELTLIFRFNVAHFLQKASDPLQKKLEFDTYTQKITDRELPKVYHLNIIIMNSVLQHDLSSKNEIKMFRVVVDKNGIRRVVHLQRSKLL